MKASVTFSSNKTRPVGIPFSELQSQEDGIYIPLDYGIEIDWRLLVTSDISGSNKTILFINQREQVLQSLLAGHGFGLWKYINTRESLGIAIG